MMHPGHPLMLAVSDVILEQHANLLRQGAVLVDPSDEGTEPWLLFMLTHEVKSGDGHGHFQATAIRSSHPGRSSYVCWLGTAPRSGTDQPTTTRSLVADAA